MIVTNEDVGPIQSDYVINQFNDQEYLIDQNNTIQSNDTFLGNIPAVIHSQYMDSGLRYFVSVNENRNYQDYPSTIQRAPLVGNPVSSSELRNRIESLDTTVYSPMIIDGKLYFINQNDDVRTAKSTATTATERSVMTALSSYSLDEDDINFTLSELRALLPPHLINKLRKVYMEDAKNKELHKAKKNPMDSMDLDPMEKLDNAGPHGEIFGQRVLKDYYDNSSADDPLIEKVDLDTTSNPVLQALRGEYTTVRKLVRELSPLRQHPAEQIAENADKTAKAMSIENVMAQPYTSSSSTSIMGKTASSSSVTGFSSPRVADFSTRMGDNGETVLDGYGGPWSAVPQPIDNQYFTGELSPLRQHPAEKIAENTDKTAKAMSIENVMAQPYTSSSSTSIMGKTASSSSVTGFSSPRVADFSTRMGDNGETVLDGYGGPWSAVPQPIDNQYFTGLAQSAHTALAETPSTERSDAGLQSDSFRHAVMQRDFFNSAAVVENAYDTTNVGDDLLKTSTPIVDSIDVSTAAEDALVQTANALESELESCRTAERIPTELRTAIQNATTARLHLFPTPTALGNRGTTSLRTPRSFHLNESDSLKTPKEATSLNTAVAGNRGMSSLRTPRSFHLNESDSLRTPKEPTGVKTAAGATSTTTDQGTTSTTTMVGSSTNGATTAKLNTLGTAALISSRSAHTLVDTLEADENHETDVHTDITIER
ncbi:hypothetical protein Q1695_010573 [Nippostrongylus brasiliensis]|nr:hypothetical protein Q1695_010573 [Nippostrongylus brasiliensis]